MIDREGSFLSHVGLFGLASLVSLMVTIMLNFLVPKHLSIEDYGYWKLFTLYVSYVGIMHFGFIDGVFIGWLGKDRREVENSLIYSLGFLLIQQAVVVSVIILVVMFVGINAKAEFILIMACIYGFIFNCFALLSYSLQATKKFGVLSFLTVFQSIFFLTGFSVLFLLDAAYWKSIIALQLAVLVVTLLTAGYCVRGCLNRRASSIDVNPGFLAYGFRRIRVGWYVLAGNFMSVFFFTIDRVFVSYIFTMRDFAFYSLAASFLTVIYVFVNTVGSVALPYLAECSPEKGRELYRVGLIGAICIWGLGLGVYFPVRQLIVWYIPNYVSSLPVLRILLLSVGFGGVINIVQSNYYKINKLVRPFFWSAVCGILVLVSLIVIGVHVWHTSLVIAIVTVIAFGVWYVFNEIVLAKTTGQGYRDIVRNVGVCLGPGCLFLLTSSLPVLWQGIVAYYFGLVGYYLLLMKHPLGGSALDLMRKRFRAVN